MGITNISNNNSGLNVGETFEFIGKPENIPYKGEFHNTSTSKIFDFEYYPDFVNLNRDVNENSSKMTIEQYISSNYSNKYMPIGYKYREDDLYYISYTGILASQSILFSQTENVLTTPANSYTGFLDKIFYKNAGVYSTNTSLNGGLESLTKYNTSPFSIKNIKKNNGDIVEGFICFGYSGTVNKWAIQVFDFNYITDFNSMGNYSERHNEVNNYSDATVLNINSVRFFDDCFYLILSGTKEIKKYSYDFSGGTLKEISNINNYISLINDLKSFSYGTYILNNGDIYQVDINNGDFYKNGIKIHTLTYNNNSLFDLTGETTYLDIIEYNGKLLIQHIGKTLDDNNKRANCYYDGVNFNNFDIPNNTNYISSINSMYIQKFDFNTGLIIANIMYTSGTKQLVPSGTAVIPELKFLISNDYGYTWFEDESIINGISPASEILIQNISSNSHIYYGEGNDHFYINSECKLKMHNYNNETDYFWVHVQRFNYGNYVARIKWNYDVPLDTLTLIGTPVESNKINKYIKVRK